VRGLHVVDGDGAGLERGDGDGVLGDRTDRCADGDDAGDDLGAVGGAVCYGWGAAGDGEGLRAVDCAGGPLRLRWRGARADGADCRADGNYGCHGGRVVFVRAVGDFWWALRDSASDGGVEGGGCPGSGWFAADAV
jgi:hypothetical protein